jgi:hypothetical protein
MPRRLERPGRIVVCHPDTPQILMLSLNRGQSVGCQLDNAKIEHFGNLRRATSGALLQASPKASYRSLALSKFLSYSSNFTAFASCGGCQTVIASRRQTKPGEGRGAKGDHRWETTSRDYSARGGGAAI